MKSNRSLADALATAKQLRRASESPEVRFPADGVTPTRTSTISRIEPAEMNHPSPWVRHTVGLRKETSLKLRDAADAQKRKSRYGTLKPDEPANEQEIADLGVKLALHGLGFD